MRGPWPQLAICPVDDAIRAVSHANAGLRLLRLLCWLIVGGLICAETGCQSSGPTSRTPPAPDPARLTGFSPLEVSAAANLYALKCGRCHQFYDPAQYNDADWQVWMRKMSRRARLNREQEELLSRYLAAFR